MIPGHYEHLLQPDNGHRSRDTLLYKGALPPSFGQNEGHGELPKSGGFIGGKGTMDFNKALVHWCHQNEVHVSTGTNSLGNSGADHTLKIKIYCAVGSDSSRYSSNIK